MRLLYADLVSICMSLCPLPRPVGMKVAMDERKEPWTRALVCTFSFSSQSVTL